MMAVIYESDAVSVISAAESLSKALTSCVIPAHLLATFKRDLLRETSESNGPWLSHFSTSFASEQLEVSSKCVLRFKVDAFNIRSPFMMDSEFVAVSLNKRQTEGIRNRESSQMESIAETAGEVSSQVVARINHVGKRKRRRHRRDKSMLTSDLADILSSILKETVHLWTTPLVAPLDNNLAARSVAAQVLSLSGSIPFEEFYENKKDDAVVQEFGGEPYVIPPRSRFISSYFRDIVCVIEDSKKYDIIVMDPPWNNKSAKRLCTYDYLQESDLRNIPIKELATEGALIVLWITNNERLKAFVENDLFPGWNTTKIAEWTWIKVTKYGEPVYPLDSCHKKPYEKLLLGRVGHLQVPRRVTPNKIILSVPSAIHSHKPPLDGLLRPFLPEQAKCLELFARSLLSDWTSWGLEVLKLQHLSLFELA